MGKGTIDKRSSGETKGKQGSSSRNYDVLGRELMTPDETRKLDNEQCLIFVRGFDPVIDKKFRPFDHPNNVLPNGVSSLATMEMTLELDAQAAASYSNERGSSW
jgi:type IV secretory pathway TraG/TraD family ATPase VirD4